MEKDRVKRNKDYYTALCAVRDELMQRKVDLDQKHYVIVPEKYSLLAEQFIVGGSGGAFDIEILSFPRLFLKYNYKEHEFLPRSGAIMLLKEIAMHKKNELSAFSKSTNYIGFAEKIYETLETIAVSKVDIHSIKAEAATRAKLNDIALMYDEYNLRTSGKYIDGIGKMQLLYDELEKADLSGINFYCAMFDYMTSMEKEIVELLKERAESFAEYTVSPPSLKYGKTEFYSSPDLYNQLVAVARRIRSGVYNGARYRDYCIIATSPDQDLTARVLSEYEIPYFIDKKQRVLDSELFRLFDYLNDVVKRGYERHVMIALTKNYYVGIDADSAEIFENYVNRYSVTYKGFFEVFDKGESSEKDTAESVRKSVVELINYYDNKRRHVTTSGQFYDFIVDILERVKAGKKTAELSEIAEVDLGQIFDNIINSAALVKKISYYCSGFDKLFALFVETLSACKVSLVPQLDDVVIVGGAQAFRARHFKKVFCIDFVEGSLPEHITDSDLITDSEVDAINGEEGKKYPSVASLNERAARELQYVLSCADELFLAYSCSGGARISQLENEIKRGADEVIYNSYVDEQNFFGDSSTYSAAINGMDNDYFQKVAVFAGSKSSCLEHLVDSISKTKTSERPLPFTAELYSVIEKETASDYIKTSAVPPAYLEEMADAFFASPSITVSKIQDYFGCPYKSFVSVVLRLAEKETGEISALDIGNFLHRAIELFVSGGDFSNPKETMSEIVKVVAQENYKYYLENNKPLYNSIVQEAIVLAEKVSLSFTASEFKNFGCELRFGHSKDNDLKTIEFEVEDRKIALRGTIDRVDVYGSDARVIDYKTGAVSGAEFKFKKYYYGKTIQLGVYLKIMQVNGKNSSGMFYFPLSARWNDDEFAHRLDGVFDSDPLIVEAYDRNLLEPMTKSRIIPASSLKNLNDDGTIRLRASQKAITKSEVESIATYSIEVMNKALQEIAEGYIKPSPEESVCSYCKMRQMCYFNPQLSDVRVMQSVSSQDIVDAVNASENK